MPRTAIFQPVYSQLMLKKHWTGFTGNFYNTHFNRLVSAPSWWLKSWLYKHAPWWEAALQWPSFRSYLNLHWYSSGVSSLYPHHRTSCNCHTSILWCSRHYSRSPSVKAFPVCRCPVLHHQPSYLYSISCTNVWGIWCTEQFVNYNKMEALNISLSQSSISPLT